MGAAGNGLTRSDGCSIHSALLTPAKAERRVLFPNVPPPPLSHLPAGGGTRKEDRAVKNPCFPLQSGLDLQCKRCSGTGTLKFRSKTGRNYFRKCTHCGATGLNPQCKDQLPDGDIQSKQPEV